MKIGILTFHMADNYGAILQAYALKEIIKSIENDVEIINYKQHSIEKNYKIIVFYKNNIFKSLIANIVYFRTRIIKKRKFNNFRKMYLNITSKVYKNSYSINGKDIYIVGSDQVWNGNITNYDTTFFLDFCNKSNKKISYAASIGKDTLTVKDLDFIKNNISNLDFISVRESTVIDTLKELTNKEIVRCLDPTLLINKNDWDKFIYNTKINGNYLLIYSLTENQEILNVAKIISKKLNLNVLYINDTIRKVRYGFKKVKQVGPEDFLSLIKNAYFVVTDSFHGTAFSIIFNKDFITVPHKTTGSRMISLLNLLKLDSRIITNSTELNDEFDYHIDFKETNNILNIEKAKSFEFLKKSIES